MSAEKNSEKIKNLTFSESYAEDLFNFLPLPVCLVSHEEKILETNPEFCKITKYQQEEIVGKTIYLIFEEKKFRKIFEEVFKKGSVHGKETIIFTKEKTIFPSLSFAVTQLKKESIPA